MTLTRLDFPPGSPFGSRRRGWPGMLAAALLAAVGCARGERSVDQLSAEPAARTAPVPPASGADERLATFARQVALDVDQTWLRDFRRRGKPYTSLAPLLTGAPPRCELPSSDCARARLHLDHDLQRLLRDRFGDAATPALVYTIAHEVGHHVQRVLQLDTHIEELLAQRPVARHAVQVQLELQADCLAGVWNHATAQRDWLPRADIETALRQASEVGTERRLQERHSAEAHAESFTYAIPRRRIYWFSRGFARGEILDCDTFAPE